MHNRAYQKILVAIRVAGLSAVFSYYEFPALSYLKGAGLQVLRAGLA